jgi:hypothetical protein
MDRSKGDNDWIRTCYWRSHSRRWTKWTWWTVIRTKKKTVLNYHLTPCITLHWFYKYNISFITTGSNVHSNAICLYRRIWLITILGKILNLKIVTKWFSWKDPPSWKHEILHITFTTMHKIIEIPTLQTYFSLIKIESYTKPKSLRFKPEVFIWCHVVYVPKSSTPFRRILICVIFRPRDTRRQ